MVQLANNKVSYQAVYAEIHPKLCDSGSTRGRFPRDFELPRRIEQFRSLESILTSISFSQTKLRDLLIDSTLDRILQSYSLPTSSLDSRVFNNRFGSLSTYIRSDGMVENARQNKLMVLLEYLGVDLTDSDRLGRLPLGIDRRQLGSLVGGSSGSRMLL